MDEAFHGVVTDGDEAFWAALERLVGESEVVIDRPRGSAHPRYPNIIYGADYGYLRNTASMDGGGIDVWRGSGEGKRISGVIVTVDLVKRDSEIKILIDCTEEEIAEIVRFHNGSEYMKGLLVRRR
ncbi:hypothetical protein [Pleomorphomonas sp. JP5]|uniref:hypothetical protein n=1 Tax=Pleomorphomonas sp. JP5 TaxID=2942998 RepID=UPI002043C271|nr:hypothetical protein [Pleomorphomonas sp. JP5]MCM5557067.1 hypothetical protein [Pleomorphomonas sp. JP5]